jgi:O-antigen/teichoic acid export membrane protein
MAGSMPPASPAPGKLRTLTASLMVAVGARSTEGMLGKFATYLPSQAVVALAGFLVLPLLARRLDPTELGVLVIAQTVITFGWTFAGSWLASALIRELPAYREANDLGTFSRVLGRGLLAAAALLGFFSLVLGAASNVSSAIGNNVWLIIAATAGLTLQNIGVSLFAADLRSVAYAVGNVVGGTSGIGLGAYFVFSGQKVHGYLLGLAISWLVVGTVTLGAAWPVGQAIASHRSSLRPWMDYGMAMSAAGLALWGLAFVDRYLLAGLKSTGAVGIYTVGNVIGDKAVTIPALAFFFASRPLLVSAYERHGRAEVERLMRVHTSVLLLIGLPAVALVGATSRDLIALLTAERSHTYAAAVTVAPIVAVGSLLFALALVAGTGLVVARKTRLLIASASAGLVVNVIANLALIPPFGVRGAALATPLGTGTYLVATYLLARRYALWHFPVPVFLQALSAAALAFAAGRFLGPLGTSHAQELVIAAFGSGIVYAGSILLLRHRLSPAR